jgi:ring-1,2-phenylacetyl-CoA epoxidase subunit PaaC
MSGIAELGVGEPALAELAALITVLAANKAALGRRYGEWAVSAPTLESGVAAAAMAQDELGHARSTYPLLKQLGLDPEDEDQMDGQGALALLQQPLPDWETFIATNLVVDGTLTAIVHTSRDSSFVPLAQRARKILQEERSHQVHAVAWTRRLASDPRHGESFASAVSAAWSAVGPLTGNGYAVLFTEGLLAGEPDLVRESVRGTVTSAVDGTGLDLELL